jgi:hypothetical protein
MDEYMIRMNEHVRCSPGKKSFVASQWMNVIKSQFIIRLGWFGIKIFVTS